MATIDSHGGDTTPSVNAANEIHRPIEIGKTKVYYMGQTRRIVCFCGTECKVSILPHLRKEHHAVWNEWRNRFVELRNRGLNYRQIMYHFLSGNDQLLFSWRVIEQEMSKILDERPDILKVVEKGPIHEWNPSDFRLERTTIWDFRTRGNWAVHDSSYRGNWPPEVPRNLILKFTKPSDLVLDPFVGGGTTLIECWLLNRRSIGIDIYPIAVKIAQTKIDEMAREANFSLIPLDPNYRPIVLEGDSQKLDVLLRKGGIKSGSVDLVCAHPPYLNSLRYSTRKGDLSMLSNKRRFLAAMVEVAGNLRRALRSNGICVILIGDVRRRGKLIPLGLDLLRVFLDRGFRLRDIIIKAQRRDFSTEFYRQSPWFEHSLAHEYLLILQK